MDWTECPDCTPSVLCPEHEEVSDPGDTLDTLVQQASVPSLATLFKRAKDKGVLEPAMQYESTTNK